MFGRRRTDTGDPKPSGRHARIEVDRNERGQWWWRFVEANNRTVCVSEMFEGRDAESVAMRQARRMAGRMASSVPVVVAAAKR